MNFKMNISDYPNNKCLHDLFRESVKRSPSKIAIVYHNHQITYEELDNLSDQLAEYLYNLGVRKDKIVGIFMEHSIEFVISYIGSLKAGGAYMALEIIYPLDLLNNVLKKTEPIIILTKNIFKHRIPSWQTIFIMDDYLKLNVPPLLSNSYRFYNIKNYIRSDIDDLAYVVMSSGTTGVPKGICCPHRGAVHSYHWRLQNYPYNNKNNNEEDRVACHVFFVWELLRPLLGNVTLYIIPDEIIYIPNELIEYLYINKITRILFTPSLLQLLFDTISINILKEKLKYLNIIWLCGEIVTMKLRNTFVSNFKLCKLINLYSVSECHDVSATDISNDNNIKYSTKYASCGSIMSNVQAYVLDEKYKIVSNGVIGELYIGGPCLAIGYLNQPDETSKRFIRHIMIDGINMGRLYRTGDKAKFLPNGHLELVGRCDLMIKIRGYSIVLSAIESAIIDYPNISSVVVLVEGEEGTDKKIIAYIVPKEWDNNKIDINRLRDFLSEKIPFYAIPSIFICLEALPVNYLSGKVDRKILPKLNSFSNIDHKGNQTIKKETVYEEVITNIWSELLVIDKETIHLNTNFFEIGGHSLLIYKVLLSLKENYGMKLQVKDIINNPRMDQLIFVIKSKLLVSDDVKFEKKKEIIDFNKEIILDSSIYPAPTRKSGYSRYRMEMSSLVPRHILLTGSTGYVGAHILYNLLNLPNDNNFIIFCLIRIDNNEKNNNGKEIAFKKLNHVFNKYNLLNNDKVVDKFNSKKFIYPVIGDLGKPLLGLSRNEFNKLSNDVDTIIHCGATVNLINNYNELKAVNVLGTMEILRLAVTNGYESTKVKPVIYISTNGVIPSTSPPTYMLLNYDKDKRNKGDHNIIFEEKINMIDTIHLLENGYGQSKLVGEKLCEEASKRGLPMAILRLGNITPSSTIGYWNENDLLYLLIKSCIIIQSYPIDVNWYFDLTPVDFAASAITYLSCSFPHISLGQVYHIQNPSLPLNNKEFFILLKRSCIIPIKGISYIEWIKELKDYCTNFNNNESECITKFLLGKNIFFKYLNNINLMDSTEMIQALDKSNLFCPQIDDKYMKKILSNI